MTVSKHDSQRETPPAPTCRNTHTLPQAHEAGSLKEQRPERHSHLGRWLYGSVARRGMLNEAIMAISELAAK